MSRLNNNIQNNEPSVISWLISKVEKICMHKYGTTYPQEVIIDLGSEIEYRKRCKKCGKTKKAN